MPTPKISIFPFIAAALILTLTLFATSCVTHDPYAGYGAFEDPNLLHDRALANAGALPSETDFSWWDPNDNPARGPLRVTISLSDQAATFYRGDTQVGRSRVATGLRTHPTPSGSFTILDKKIDKHSNLYGRVLDAEGNILVSDADSRQDQIPAGGRFDGASMPYWMRLTTAGVGMHAGPIPNPGRPASHGCIRMPREMARRLFENAPTGTPVTIVP